MRTLVRVIGALLAASLAPAALFMLPLLAGMITDTSNDSAAWWRFSRWLLLVLGTSTSYVLVLGLPALLLLHWRRAIRWWSSILAGCVLACLPVAVSLWPSDNDMQSTASHWNGERMVDTMINGVATLEGWIQYAQVLGTFGLFGAVGGLAGWLVWYLLRPDDER